MELRLRVQHIVTITESCVELTTGPAGYVWTGFSLWQIGADIRMGYERQEEV